MNNGWHERGLLEKRNENGWLENDGSKNGWLEQVNGMNMWMAWTSGRLQN